MKTENALVVLFMRFDTAAAAICKIARIHSDLVIYYGKRTVFASSAMSDLVHKVGTN